MCFLLNFLYTETRGAHTYWLSKETVDARPDHILNLIHYEVIFLFHFPHMLLLSDMSLIMFCNVVSGTGCSIVGSCNHEEESWWSDFRGL